MGLIRVAERGRCDVDLRYTAALLRGVAGFAATTPIPASGLLAYSRARGVFAGMTVDGSTLRSDDDDNAAIYGRKVDQSDILTGKIKPTGVAQPLLSVLRRYYRANPSSEPPPKDAPK